MVVAEEDTRFREQVSRNIKNILTENCSGYIVLYKSNTLTLSPRFAGRNGGMVIGSDHARIDTSNGQLYTAKGISGSLLPRSH